MVGVVLPEGLVTDFAAALRSGAGDAVEIVTVPWQDTARSRRAKARQDRSPAWVRRHEQPLPEELRARLARCEVVVGFEAPIDLVAHAPGLRFVQSPAAGTAPLVGVLRPTGVPLASAAGVSGAKVAEFALARLFAVWTDQRTLEALQRGRRWSPEAVDTTPIGGRTVLVVGTGDIGAAVASRAAAFDLRVLGVRRRPELGSPPGFARVVGPDQLGEALGEADAVVLAAPATPRTVRLIGAGELAAMRRGAVLVNVARGSLVDEEALVAALGTGHLGAAVLDVTGTEPLSRRSPLWRAPNTYLSPHVANDWRPEHLEAVAALLLENVARDREGKPLRSAVDLDEGY